MTATNDICFHFVDVIRVSLVFVIVKKNVFNMALLLCNILGLNTASVSDIGLDRRGIPG